MTTPPAAIEAAYKVLDRHGLVKHAHCEPDFDGCIQAIHERAQVEKVAAAVLAADDSKPSIREALQRAFR